MLHLEEVTQMWRSCCWEPVLTWKQRTMEAHVAMPGNGRVFVYDLFWISLFNILSWLYHMFILDLCNILEIWFYTHVCDDVSWFIIFNVYKIFYHELVYIIGLNILEIWRFFAFRIFCQLHHPLLQLLSINLPSMLAFRQVGRLCSLLHPMGRFHLFRCCWMLEPRWMRRMTTVPGPKSQSYRVLAWDKRSTKSSCLKSFFNPYRISNFESSCFPFETDQ